MCFLAHFKIYSGHPCQNRFSSYLLDNVVWPKICLTQGYSETKAPNPKEWHFDQEKQIAMQKG